MINAKLCSPAGREANQTRGSAWRPRGASCEQEGNYASDRRVQTKKKGSRIVADGRGWKRTDLGRKR